MSSAAVVHLAFEAAAGKIVHKFWPRSKRRNTRLSRSDQTICGRHQLGLPAAIQYAFSNSSTTGLNGKIAVPSNAPTKAYCR